MSLQYYSDALDQKKERCHFRELKTFAPHLVDFCSNDYLGLSRNRPLHQRILNHCQTKLANDALLQHGATGSRLVSGESTLAHDLEVNCQDYFKGESALLFNSGYVANLAVFSTLPLEQDLVIYDEQCHASIREGLRLGKARSYGFRHNDLQHLEQRIKRLQIPHRGRIFIAVEALYSMDGDFAPLAEIIALAKRLQALVIVDEAHTTGICGPAGAGLSVQMNLHPDIFLRLMTFGKAFGSAGAVVICPQVIRDYLINFAKPFIYSTGLPTPTLISLHETMIWLSQHQQHLVDELQAIIDRFNQLAANFPNLKIKTNDSPIQAIMIAGNQKVTAAAHFLQTQGFAVAAMRSPTVASGTERLRISLHAFNTQEDIKQLLEACSDFMNTAEMQKETSHA